MNLSFIDVRGAKLSVVTAGEGSVFIWGHGVTSSRSYEDDTNLYDISALSEESLLVRYDARGHGESDATFKTEDYQWDSLGQDMVTLASSIGAKEYVAGGISMGCATALYAAIASPNRVRALVLATPPAAWNLRKIVAKQYRKLAKIVETEGRAGLIYELKRRQPPDFLANDYGRILESKLRNIALMDQQVLPHIYRGAAASDLPAPVAIETLKIPTLILAWPRDPGHPVRTAKELNKLIQGSELSLAAEPKDICEWPAQIALFLRRLDY